MNDQPTVAQGLLFGALALLAVLPLVSLVCKSSALRESAAEWGCWKCVACCDRIFGAPAGHADDNVDLESGRDEPRTVARYYRMLYAHHATIRHPVLALGLTTWREDVRHYTNVRDVFDMKLQQIQIQDEPMQRSDPTVVALSDTDVALAHPQQHQADRGTVLCSDEEEEKAEEA